MDFLLALVVERAWRKHDIEVNFSEVSSSWHFLFLCTMKNIWGKNNLLNFLCRSPIFLFSIVYCDQIKIKKEMKNKQYWQQNIFILNILYEGSGHLLS